MYSIAAYSNTSHVNLYPNVGSPIMETTQIQIHLMLIFILIASASFSSMHHSNTSHVNLYHIRSLFVASSDTNSNTSHVNLYPALLLQGTVSSRIQIHLMLIFIVHLLICFLLPIHYSNTSHVNLYQYPPRGEQ